ncbi:MAG: iron ABC transporter permease [Chloroflexota bacterium]
MHSDLKSQPVTQLTYPHRQQAFWPKIRAWLGRLPVLLLTIILLFPIGVLAVELFTLDIALWQRMWGTILPRVLWNTLRLVVGVSLGTLVVGVGCAWLVTAYEFPGRRWFERLLMLPLAIPGFIMGFVYVAMFEFAGPVQTALREQFDWSRNDYWFPNIASPGGLILVLTLVLYPYVYILARSAFREQAANTLEAANVLGYEGWQAFRRVALPLARPQIAVGVLLVTMESLTDYGTVSYFSYPTLSERIVVLWNTSFDVAAATELASLMVIIALILLFGEQVLRRQARFYQQGSYGRRMARKQLVGARGWLTTFGCFVVLGAAFILPMTQLTIWSIRRIQEPTITVLSEPFLEYTRNTLLLGLIGAVTTVVIALFIAYSNRRDSIETTNYPRWLSRLMTIGYAMPGAVIAVGVLTVVNPIDGAVTDFATVNLGYTGFGYLLTGTVIALVYGYAVRFMALAFNSISASVDKVKPTMESAARTLGAGSGRIFRRIHIPLVRTGIGAGAILVFVDTMKELPITMLLRPFGVDTLAVRTHLLSVEGFHESAAIPSLMILVAGLLPVFLLMQIGANEDQIQ